MWLAAFAAGAQGIVISGKVTDATTGDAIPFANVYFKHLRKGATTNFEGYYSFKVKETEDSLTADYLGYRARSKKVVTNASQTINFQLEPSVLQMQEVVIKAGENPAWAILRKVWSKKEFNNKSRLDAYQYKSYSKVEIDAVNISEKFKHSRAMRPFRKVFDSVRLAAGEDGKPVLPFFLSETMSDFYYLKSPERKSEHITASKITGIGLQQGTVASQLVGSSFQDYNFYDNWMQVLDKNFISPVSTEGLSFYKYYLVDSLTIDGKWCYKIQFKPKNIKDLAFTGNMWIADTSFALKRIVVETGEAANLNYIKRLKIQQDLEPTTSEAWMPAKIRITVQIVDITGNSFGLLGKLYVANKDFKVNEPQNMSRYDSRISLNDSAKEHSEAFWARNRPDSLTKGDLQAMHTIDTIRHMPRIRTYIDIADVIVNGYYRAGPVDIGPYLLLYGHNIEEGDRFRLGFRTNGQFSKRWILKGYAAIGTRDFDKNGLKYNISVERFLSRRHWTKVGIQNKYDIEGLGFPDDFFATNNLLTASQQLGLLRRLDLVRIHRIWFETDLAKGLSLRLYALHKTIQPRGDFVFGYYPYPEQRRDRIETMIHISEAVMSMRYAFKETYVVNDNRRAHIGLDKAPIVNLTYAVGFRNILQSHFNTQRVSLEVTQKFRAGFMGRGDYHITATKVFARLPYPLLNILPGNETIFRTDRTFNMMSFFEFVTDQAAYLFYTQHLDGILFNRIPLLNRLKLREVVGFKAAWGSLSARNDITSPIYPDPKVYPITPFSRLDPNVPYLEVSYGIENIFKILRIDVIHRLNYLYPGVQKIGVKGSLYFSF